MYFCSMETRARRAQRVEIGKKVQFREVAIFASKAKINEVFWNIFKRNSSTLWPVEWKKKFKIAFEENNTTICPHIIYYTILPFLSHYAESKHHSRGPFKLFLHFQIIIFLKIFILMACFYQCTDYKFGMWRTRKDLET